MVAYPPSSTKSFFSASSEVAAESCDHCSSRKSPTRSACNGMEVLAESSLSINCSAGISSEKNATPSLRSMALSAMFKTSAVFPIAGLAAMITKSPLPKPEVLSFKFLKPVSTPISLEFPRALRRSISSIIASVISLDSLKSSLVLFCVIS